MRVYIFAYAGDSGANKITKKLKKTPSEKMLLSVLLGVCIFVFEAKKSQPNKITA